MSILLGICAYLLIGSLFVGLAAGYSKEHGEEGLGVLIVTLLVWPLALSVFLAYVCALIIRYLVYGAKP